MRSTSMHPAPAVNAAKKGLAMVVLALSVILAAACGSLGGEADEHEEDGGPLMRPGENCQSCHSFAVAGTLYGGPTAAASEGLASGTITVTDAAGEVHSFTSNGVGNFYGSKPVKFPLTASVTVAGVTKSMTTKVYSGACSSCHAATPTGGAPGRLYGSAL